MRALLDELDKRGVKYGHLSPAIFSDMMDEMTGARHLPTEKPEDAAERWLKALNA